MSKSITIEMFPAGNGDAVLVDTEDQLILIDGGYTSTFRDHLRPRLEQLNQDGRRLSLLVVTHIDADHISGIIALLKANGDSENPNVIRIDDIWFNSYRHLHLSEKNAGTFDGDVPAFEISGGLESKETEEDNLLVSHAQGTTLASLILKHGYNWNSKFGGKAIVANSLTEIPFGENGMIALLGPSQEALDKLAKRWFKYLQKRFDGKINEDSFFDDAFELMMEEMRQEELNDMIAPDPSTLVSASGDWVTDFTEDWNTEDKSPTNGSSIIFMLTIDNQKLLFLGDAHPNSTLAKLKQLGFNPHQPLEVDVLKVTHHGAWYNNSPELIQSIKAKNYLFSSNGKRHHHPHYQTMAWIVKSHGNEDKKNLFFNYKQAQYLGNVYHSDMKEEYNYTAQGPQVDEFGQGLDGYIKMVFDG